MVNIDVSQPEHTPAGRFLERLYYSGVLGALVNRECRSGFPHNGGFHTLHLKMKRADLVAFADILDEQFGKVKGAAEFVAVLRQH